MSKSIPVSSCAYSHTEDINPDEHVSADRLDDAMDRCVNLSVTALDQPSGAYNDLHRANIASIFKSIQSTHQTIRKIIKLGDENPMSVDALALARVPLEGLYTLCIMFENPSWVDCYLRDGWKKKYTQFLLRREETKQLPRCDAYSKKFGPENLASLRQILGITEAQQATIDREELATPLPPGITKAEIPRFPTPRVVIEKLPAGDKRRMLERLYWEYEYLCSFAHGLDEANLFKTMFNKDSRFRPLWNEAQIKDTFQRQVGERAYSASRISIIQSAAELLTLYPANVELSAAVVKAWEWMSNGHLLGRAIWNLRTKKLLGVLS